MTKKEKINSLSEEEIKDLLEKYLSAREFIVDLYGKNWWRGSSYKKSIDKWIKDNPL